MTTWSGGCPPTSGAVPRNGRPATRKWADFFEWRLREFAGDARARRLLAQWTDSMAYTCRRVAARARGVDPGEWVPQHERRPDLNS